MKKINRNRKNLTQKRLRYLFFYNAKTGEFKRRVNRVRGRKGVVVKKCFDRGGYLIVTIDYTIYTLHRLAWLYIKGYCSEVDVEHKDRDKSNNSFSNLREASRTCNNRNRGLPKNNTSTVVGVRWVDNRNKYIGVICVNKQKVHLKYHEHFSDAVFARWEAEKKHKFPNCCTTSTAYEYLKSNNLI